MRKKKNSKPISVESTRHKDTRVNIPTEELRRFVDEDELTPKVMLYPRDPSLDPQLVWKGKDEQDREDLAVPIVPVYIQEKIHPHALIEDLRRRTKADEPEPLSLFADFNGITDFETKIDFYNHEQNWTNRMILGDSLLVMNSLAEKEGLKGKVQMIYIDPPYGIKFSSNWQVSTRKRDVKDGSVEHVTRQPEQIKAFRDTWELGIHSYLSYLRDRLVVARELLTETGSIFVQIGDENVHLVRCLMDEVFGSENFLSLITFVTSVPLGATYLPGVTNYLLWYGKHADQTKFRRIYLDKATGGGTAYDSVELPDGRRRGLTSQEKLDPGLLPEGSRYFFNLSLLSAGTTASCVYDFVYTNRTFSPGGGRSWKTTKEGMTRLGRANRIFVAGNTPRYVLYADDYPVSEITNIWADTGGATDKVYVVQTMNKVIERCLLMTTDPGDLVLDPTCGSGTTAYVAEQWGRRWITIDTSRVALAIARTRLMSAKYPYYILADSPEGVAKEAEIAGILPSEQKTEGDIKKGFVYKRVPHITLRSIANNEEIDVIHAKWQEKLEPIREKLNSLLGKSWEEWEIPREPEKTWPVEAATLLEEWWKLRRERQKEIDDSIARNADMEMLYDQPYEDSSRIRVTGPFTVESLSPHRRMSVEQKIRLREEGTHGWKYRELGAGDFGLRIIENLKKAGVQNTIKNERLKFETLDVFAGEYIHAAGEYMEGDKVKRVAVTIGPEFGTVDRDLIREAAKEAMQGVGFDTLIVCGFAFDPHVSEEAKKYGRLTVLPTRMNPDLSMGDELLKKTGAANLFMIFGEPDIQPVDAEGRLVPGKDGKIVVEIRGLDIYDPTTGEIRNNSTDDIACWFIDTDYDGESFFVRHAYFTGADEPYERLKKALKAEINEDAWASLYRTVSRPFDPPADGHKVAIKVINHYGDEVLKVYDVAR